MDKILFIDRDGTLIQEPEDKQIDSFEKLFFLPSAISYLRKIALENEYRLVMVTNQDGLGTKSFPTDTFWPIHNKMLAILKSEEIVFDEVLIDSSFAYENLNTRKPKTALVTHYMNGNYDLEHSYVIGDRTTDIEFANNLGCKSIFIGNETFIHPTHKVFSWKEIYHCLKLKPRISIVKRKTKETNIHLTLNLDGVGKTNIKTGIAFFDHMLEQLSYHSQIDLSIDMTGDLEVDEHHSIEDVAITLGEGFRKALGDKKGIQRYGFLLPMDDVLAQVAIDFSGRPWCVWEASFSREYIGKMPTEMFFHFFKSFSDTCLCNINIKADGKNEHHKIEAIFKAMGKSIKRAKERNLNEIDYLPSTKGML